MSSTRDLVDALKAELKAAGLTYAELAAQLGMSESSIKRMFSQADMPLSRIDEVLRVLRLDFTDLARRVADAAPPRRELTAEQERAVVADRRLLLVAICCLSQWTAAQIQATYTIGEAELVLHLAALDKLGVIELRAGNRYRLLLDKTFRWRPDGPLMRYFRAQVVADYYGGGFDGEGESLILVHGEMGAGGSRAFSERLARLAQDFARQHTADQRLPADRKRPYTLVLGMRSWLFAAFTDLRRDAEP
jgi:transcriptional regulator with XRE-family HTH domain